MLIRASQINGCAVCADMHTKDAVHAGETQLAALVCTITSINAYNRFNVILKNQGGDYQPGQWG